jgi:hypothetical protein
MTLAKSLKYRGGAGGITSAANPTRPGKSEAKTSTTHLAFAKKVFPLMPSAYLPAGLLKSNCTFGAVSLPGAALKYGFV